MDPGVQGHLSDALAKHHFDSATDSPTNYNNYKKLEEENYNGYYVTSVNH